VSKFALYDEWGTLRGLKRRRCLAYPSGTSGDGIGIWGGKIWTREAILVWTRVVVRSELRSAWGGGENCKCSTPRTKEGGNARKKGKRAEKENVSGGQRRGRPTPGAPFLKGRGSVCALSAAANEKQLPSRDASLARRIVVCHCWNISRSVRDGWMEDQGWDLSGSCTRRARS
jgi:hypothetical protein